MSDIGRRLRRIRHARGKSLAVVAGLAGISPSYLSRIETGSRAIDRRSLITALANALEVSPTDLLHEPDPAQSNVAVDAVRRALLVATAGAAGGPPLPLPVLTARLSALLDAQQQCRHDVVGRALPGLIVDVHRTPEALHLVPLLHVQGTQAWLRDVGAPLDLGWLAATTAQRAAEEVDDPTTSGLAAFGTAHGLLAAGSYDLAADVLRAANRRTSTPELLQLTGMLTLTDSLLAAARGDRSGSAAALDHATALANRIGEANALWFGFGRSNIAVWRMAVALESGDHARAATISADVDPDAIPSPQRKAAYWSDRARALAHLRGHLPAAVTALRRAESISPTRVHHHPFTRALLTDLLSRPLPNTTTQELHALARRAGLISTNPTR